MAIDDQNKLPPPAAPAASSKVSRRGFFKRGGKAGLSSAAALTVVTASSADAAIKWDRAADIVVIGSGAAGMPAAVAACEAGASVIVVEKCFDVGGRAILSGGNLQFGCGNPLQVAAGVKDSPDQFFLDWTGSEGEYSVDEKSWGHSAIRWRAGTTANSSAPSPTTL